MARCKMDIKNSVAFLNASYTLLKNILVIINVYTKIYQIIHLRKASRISRNYYNYILIYWRDLKNRIFTLIDR